MQSLFDLIQWVKREGEPRSLQRIRLRLLSKTLAERINLDEVTPETDCSADYLRTFRSVAEEVVEKANAAD